MPELRDDTTDDGFHEIQFSSKQLVFLFMAASAILISVFIFGVLVGRDTTTRPAEEPISGNSPAAPEPQPTASGPEPAATTASPAPSDLDYPKSLGDGANNKPGSSTATPPEAAAPPTPVPEPAQEPQKQAPVAESPKPTPPPDTPKTNPTPVSQAAKPANAGPNVPTTGKPGQWVLQVSALRTRQAAAESVQRLISKGYDAYLEDTAKGLYRVRIGKFKDREEALRVARRYEKEEGTKLAVQR